MKKHITIVEKTTSGLSAYVSDLEGVVTTGADLSEIKTNMTEALSLYYKDEPNVVKFEVTYVDAK